MSANPVLTEYVQQKSNYTKLHWTSSNIGTPKHQYLLINAVSMDASKPYQRIELANQDLNGFDIRRYDLLLQDNPFPNGGWEGGVDYNAIIVMDLNNGETVQSNTLRFTSKRKLKTPALQPSLNLDDEIKLTITEQEDIDFVEDTTFILNNGTDIFTHVRNAKLYPVITNGGSGYQSGYYNNVPLTGGSGTGLMAIIDVVDNSVASVTIKDPHLNVIDTYSEGDVLSADNASLGNVSGASGLELILQRDASVEGTTMTYSLTKALDPRIKNSHELEVTCFHNGANGASEMSGTIMAEPSAVPNPAQNISLQRLVTADPLKDSYNLLWSDPNDMSEYNGRDALTSYEVFLKIDDGEFVSVETSSGALVTGEARQYAVGELDINKEVTLRVVYRNDTGEGAPADASVLTYNAPLVDPVIGDLAEGDRSASFSVTLDSERAYTGHSVIAAVAKEGEVSIQSVEVAVSGPSVSVQFDSLNNGQVTDITLTHKVIALDGSTVLLESASASVEVLPFAPATAPSISQWVSNNLNYFSGSVDFSAIELYGMSLESLSVELVSTNVGYSESIALSDTRYDAGTGVLSLFYDAVEIGLTEGSNYALRAKVLTRHPREGLIDGSPATSAAQPMIVQFEAPVLSDPAAHNPDEPDLPFVSFTMSDYDSRISNSFGQLYQLGGSLVEFFDPAGVRQVVEVGSTTFKSSDPNILQMQDPDYPDLTLIAGVQYKVKLRTIYSWFFQSRYTKATTITITPYVRASAPLEFSLGNTNGVIEESRIPVFWSSPEQDGGRPVIQYKITVDELDSDKDYTLQVEDLVVSEGKFFFMIDGLSLDGGEHTTPVETGVTYNVKIAAVTDGDLGALEGAESGPSPYTPGKAPEAITSVSVDDRDQELFITWQAPSDNGFEIIRYDVSLKDEAGAEIALDLDGQGNGIVFTPEVTLSGLTNGEKYTVGLIAVNSIGSSTIHEFQAIPHGAMSATVSVSGPANKQLTVNVTLNGNRVKKIIAIATDSDPARSENPIAEVEYELEEVYTGSVTKILDSFVLSRAISFWAVIIMTDREDETLVLSARDP